MGLSLGHLLVLLLLVFVLFGAGKLPRVMGDIGKGIRNLREGMNADEPKQEVLPPAKKKKPATRSTASKTVVVKSAKKKTAKKQ